MPSINLLIKPLTAGLRGSVPVPSDKSISHRALIFAGLASGTSKLTGFSYGEDNVCTLGAFRTMGISIDDDTHGTVLVHGKGLRGLSAPKADIECGNSGTSMRLLAGLMAAQPFGSRLVGDESLSRRPMGRIAHPLRQRGASIDGVPHPTKAGELTAPLVVGPLPPGERLKGYEYQLQVASAQVKSALLLSGLFASGPTVVAEPVVSRDHTERMLQALGMPIQTTGSIVSLHPPADPNSIRAFESDLPGDLSAAAFMLVAAQIVPNSQVTTRHTGLNPTRTGIVDVIRALGGQLAIVPRGETLNEPVGELTAASAALRGGTIAGELAVRAIDEIPIACALAARARGATDFADVAELRVKESDRIALMVRLLQAFGVEASEREDGFSVVGRPDGVLKAARIQSGGDHRIAMTGAVLGLLGDGETIIEDVACIATSFPRFVATLRALGAQIEVVQ